MLPRPKAPTVFLTGGYGLGLDRSSHLVTSQGGLDTDLSGRTPWRSFGVGTFLTPGAVLFGYHTSSSREVSLEYLGGVLFVSQRQHSMAQISTNTDTPLVSPMVTDAYAYKSAAIAGADVNIALGRHLAVVPEFRAWSLGGTFSIRSSVTFRVNF
jgi:hypothetical protein